MKLRDGTAEVPLVRLDQANPELFEEAMLAIERVAGRGAFTLGEEVHAFEHAFADFCGVSQAIGVSSGTEALVLALRALGIGPADRVVVPANSFIATAEAVTLVGAAPRLADVDPVTHMLTADTLERSLTPQCRGVIPVHLYGRTVDMDPILELAEEHGLFVVEDSCQAHGAVYGERRAGALGHCGCFSFYPTKNLGAWGDGGAVVTSDAELADRIRLLRSHGEGLKNRHAVCGTTARLDAVQAAVLRVKLPLLDGWNAERRRIARELSERLDGAPIELPAPPPEAGDHVYHLYVLTSSHRDSLREYLAQRGVATAVHYPSPIHLQDAYAYLGLGRGSHPVAERLARRVLTLPLFPGMTTDQIDRTVDAVWDFFTDQERVEAT